MKKKVSVILAMFAGALGLFAAGGAGAASNPAYEAAREGEPSARPIPAWVEFCRRNAAECAVDPSEPAFVRLDDRIWRKVVAINAEVNAEVQPVTDAEQWGVADRWSFPETGAGDCEDYQLLKRKLLVEAGIPRRALRMTVVIDEKNEGHAVLMIRTDRGDFVLDNKIDAILPWHQTGYVYVKRESQDAIAWTSLGGARSPVATANR